MRKWILLLLSIASPVFAAGVRCEVEAKALKGSADIVYGFRYGTVNEKGLKWDLEQGGDFGFSYPKGLGSYQAYLETRGQDTILHLDSYNTTSGSGNRSLRVSFMADDLSAETQVGLHTRISNVTGMAIDLNITCSK